MKLDSNFDSLQLAAAAMQGIDTFCKTLCELQYPYQAGLKEVIQFAHNNRGTVQESSDQPGVTVIQVGQEKVYCFQLYQDSDRFYYEI